MFELPIAAITEWIGEETKEPRRSQFRQTYSNTKKLLAYELEKANAIESSIRLEMFIHKNQVRADGNLRADAKPFKQGVILRFTRIKKRLKLRDCSIKTITEDVSLPCDSFDDWQDNLRAIALSMEALRKVERFGVFKYGDMISRLALPSPSGDLPTTDKALAFVSEHSGYTLNDLRSPDILKLAIRAVKMKFHQDNQKTGSIELWNLTTDYEKHLQSA